MTLYILIILGAIPYKISLWKRNKKYVNRCARCQNKSQGHGQSIMSNFFEKLVIVVGTIIVVIVMVFVSSLILAWPIQLLWNWLMPIIFNLTTITFWQAWGLLMMSQLLIKSSSSSSKKDD